MKNTIVLIAALALIILASGCIFGGQQTPTDNTDTTTDTTPALDEYTAEEQQVLTELAQDSRVKNYIDTNLDYALDILLLDETELAKLRNEQPAIYDSSINAGFYRVYYSAESSGLLVLYNPIAKQIVKIYPVQNLVL